MMTRARFLTLFASALTMVGVIGLTMAAPPSGKGGKDKLTLAVTLASDSISKGESVQGTVSHNNSNSPVEVTLISSNPGVANVDSARVTVQPGQSATFHVVAAAGFSGDQTVVISATAEGYESGSASLTTVEPTPPGTIYFQVSTPAGDQTWGMDGAGNNKFQALPQGVFGNPSSLLYGGDRWWLVTAEDGRVYNTVIRPDGSVITDFAHRELFAVSWSGGELIWQQVCDSFGVFRFPTPQTGEFNGPSPNGGFFAQWSTDGTDNFAYSVGTDISTGELNYEPDGTITLDLSNGYNSSATCCIDVPDGSMTLGQSIAAGITLGPAAISMVPGERRHPFVANHFAADGLSILEEISVTDPADGSVLEQELRDTLTGSTLWVAPLGGRKFARWSPVGGQIAISFGGDDEGIWTCQADASGYGVPTPLFLLGGKYNDATDPRWSPDAGHLVFRQKLWKKGNYKTHLYRIKNDGTGIVNLTDDLDDTSKWPFRWTSNLNAPSL